MSKKRQQRSRYIEYGGQTDKYKWDQYEDEVTLSVNLGKGVRARDVECTIKNKHLLLTKKSEKPFIDGELYAEVLPDQCTWTIEDGVVDIILAKSPGDPMWWKSVIVGDPGTDVEAIEASKVLDDSILKKIWDQKQKQKSEAAEQKKKEEESKKDEGEKKEETKDQQ